MLLIKIKSIKNIIKKDSDPSSPFIFTKSIIPLTDEQVKEVSEVIIEAMSNILDTEPEIMEEAEEESQAATQIVQHIEDLTEKLAEVRRDIIFILTF